MKAIYETCQFRRDIKKLKKQGKNVEKLKDVVKRIANDERLEDRYRNHALIGQWRGSRDCHIEPDWLLIYRIDEGYLYLERSGSHSDLFNK